jgi:hypothetical protein
MEREAAHICIHTYPPLWYFRRTTCSSLSWTLRTLIYDFSLTATTHRCDSVPSCIIINSSIKYMFDSQNGRQYFLHAISAAQRKFTQFFWHQESHT